MFNIVLFVFLGLPLLGVIAMETGQVSPFLDVPGRPNGAALAYLIHLVFFFTAYRWGVSKRFLIATPQINFPSNAQNRLDLYSVACLTTFAALAGLMLFAFRGIDVLFLNMDKADFRVSLGPLGGLMTLATKWVMPAMFAGLVISCVQMGWNGLRLPTVGLCTICLFAVAASWGYKTTFLVMLLPAVLLATRSVKIGALIGMSAFAVINVILFSLFFDQHDSLEKAFEALSFRLTVLQGDLAWYTWDSAVAGFRLPDYWKTFLPIIGDGLLRSLTGADPAGDYAEWASYYFGPAMTLFGGYPVEGLMSGVSNQATLFGEVLVIGGKIFFPAISALSGLVVAYVRSTLDRASATGQHALSATVATFFSFTILSWLIGNGFASLFYLINLVGAVGTYLLLSVLLPRPVDAVSEKK